MKLIRYKQPAYNFDPQDIRAKYKMVFLRFPVVNNDIYAISEEANRALLAAGCHSAGGSSMEDAVYTYVFRTYKDWLFRHNHYNWYDYADHFIVWNEKRAMIQLELDEARALPLKLANGGTLVKRNPW